MNPLEALIQQLLAGSGPRGAMFAGRNILPGETSTPEEILRRPAIENPDAEGFSNLAPLIGGAGITRQIMRIPGAGAAEGRLTGAVQGIKGYHVIDGRTGDIIRSFPATHGKAASRLVDKLDNEYGAVRYARKPIYE